jgi:hypothetical protein
MNGDNNMYKMKFISNIHKFIKIFKKRSKTIFRFNFFKKPYPKVLAIVNHYYGENNNFIGKSNTQASDVRKRIVEEVIEELKKIPNIDIKVCGIKNKSLIDLNKDFSLISSPAFLIYNSIEWMTSLVDKYDYFINIEDDVLLTRDTFEKILKFDEESGINECFHPNRMECEGNDEYCVDLKVWGGWTDISKKYDGIELRVANNPHSAVAVFSRRKLLYAIQKTDLKCRDRIVGYYMASAYCNLHKPFLLFRSFNDIKAHTVLHLDNWKPASN